MVQDWGHPICPPERICLNLSQPSTAILSLARAGATMRAWDYFVSAGLAEVRSDPSVLTLKGRLLKDRARKAIGDAAAQLYLQSAEAYSAAAALRPDSYPLINAATMALFARQPDRMAVLAQKVLTMLDSGTGVGETPYWHEATRAEALLLLGRRLEARAALDNAISAAAAAWEDRAATLRQFRQILGFQGETSDWLSNFAPPASLYFRGLIGVASDDPNAAELAREAINNAHTGFGFGALAAGADILIAEALIECGAELNLVLPIPVREFRAQSVEPYGAAWLPRFDRLIEQAVCVTHVDSGETLTDAAIVLAAMVAKGAAIENAGRLEGTATGLEMSDARSGKFDAVRDQFVALERSATMAPSALPKGSMKIALASDRPGDSTEGWSPIGHGLHVRDAGTLTAARRQLASLRKATPDARVALRIGTDDASAGSTGDYRASLLRLVQCADVGMTIADAVSARALLSAIPDLLAEPLGELPDMNGGFEIYAIDLKA